MGFRVSGFRFGFRVLSGEAGVSGFVGLGLLGARECGLKGEACGPSPEFGLWASFAAILGVERLFLGDEM